jgi:catechol 2,3-dioxygenase-like lactoylglutathione lyase family enzyme
VRPPRALWLPYEVVDLDAAIRFWTVHLGLSKVDGWDRDGERGVVLHAADAAYVELVTGPDRVRRDRVAPPAFELADTAAVDAVCATLAGSPHRYPRGHYGFTVSGPAGAPVMIWSET